VYNLALEIEEAHMRLGGGSLRLDGSQSLYNEIWKVKVPPKVQVFAWKLSQDGLATQSNKHP
jgi:hypothetical protein